MTLFTVETLRDRWDRFWFAEIPPHIYALLRITLGAIGLITLIRIGDMTFWDLDAGLISDRGLEWLKATLRESGGGAVAGRLLYAASLIAFSMMVAGFKSHVAVPLALVCSLVQLSWNSLPLSGAHATLQSLLFCLMWADTGSVWSCDAWLEHRRAGPSEPSPTSIAPLRLLRYQIGFLYLVTGLWKLMNPSWRDGTAVHYVLNSNVFHRFPVSLPPALEGVTILGTYLTLFWELGFGLMLLWRPTRLFALVLGILMHLGILSAMEVGPFHFVMLAAYPAFLEPPRIVRFSRYLRRHQPMADSVQPVGR